MPRINGLDRDGVPRVYADDDDREAALAACRDEATDYVRRRPDTGPLDRWLFTE